MKLQFERQASGANKGKLHKSTKRQRAQTSVSIPAKMKTDFIKVKKTKGFGASSSRFTDSQISTEVPGPGQYDLYTETVWKDNKESQSRKGWGGFISNDLRIARSSIYQNTGPGPGTYISKALKGSSKGISFAQARSDVAELNPMKKGMKNSNSIRRRYMNGHNKQRMAVSLGPGCYNPKLPKSKQNPGMLLKSRTKRMNQKENDVPPPGTYEISKKFAKEKEFLIKAPMRCFAGTVNRYAFKPTEFASIKKKLDKGMGIKERLPLKEDKHPRVGDYDVQKSFDALQKGSINYGIQRLRGYGTKSIGDAIKKIGSSRAFLAGERFKNEKPILRNIQEDMRSDFDKEAWYGPNSIFLSATKRNPFPMIGTQNLGLYNPVLPPTKEDFHFNRRKKWVG